MRRCKRCQCFIPRESTSAYCGDCWDWYYAQVGMLPDDRIPRSVRQEYQRQATKRAAEWYAYSHCATCDVTLSAEDIGIGYMNCPACRKEAE